MSKYRINHEYKGAPWDFSVEELVNGEWVVKRTFNEMSDDYAHTNARDFIKWLEKEDTVSVAPVLPGVPS